MTLAALKKLIAENKLREALEQLEQYNQLHGNGELHNLIVLQAGKLAQYEKEAIIGTIDYASLARTRVNISLALLEIIDRFPKEEIPRKQKQRGITEGRYRTQLLVFLILGKVSIFLYVLTIWQSGGLTFSGFLGTLGIIIPVFATYLSIAWEDTLSKKNQQRFSNKLFINRRVQMGGYVAFIIYYAALFLVLYLQTVGEIPDPGKANEAGISAPTFANFFGLLALIESTLGVYVHKLIFSFFKKEA